MFLLLFPKKDEQETLPSFSNGHNQLFLPLNELLRWVSSDQINYTVSTDLLSEIELFNFTTITSEDLIDPILDIKFIYIFSPIINERAYLYSLGICYFLAYLKKLIVNLIRLQYIAYEILNRLSASPTPQKKEPPIGGVKVGGKRLSSAMLPRILYTKPIFILEHATW